MNLSGSSVLITGGASGIGAALARKVTEKGARVGLVDRDADGLARTAEGLAGAETAVADLRDREGITGAVDELAARLGGGLDVVGSAAGRCHAPRRGPPARRAPRAGLGPGQPRCRRGTAGGVRRG